MKLEGVDTRSEMVSIQKCLQRSRSSSPAIPPFLFDLPWYRGCKLSARLPWHRRPPVTLLWRRVLQKLGRLKIITVNKKQPTNQTESKQNVNGQRLFREPLCCKPTVCIHVTASAPSLVSHPARRERDQVGPENLGSELPLSVRRNHYMKERAGRGCSWRHLKVFLADNLLIFLLSSWFSPVFLGASSSLPERKHVAVEGTPVFVATICGSGDLDCPSESSWTQEIEPQVFQHSFSSGHGPGPSDVLEFQKRSRGCLRLHSEDVITQHGWGAGFSLKIVQLEK